MTKLLEVKLHGCETLKNIAEPVSEVTPDLKSFISDMIFTMYENDGVGIAAPQVGLSKRIFICDYDYSKSKKKNPQVIINPEFIEFSGEQTSEEGCLSFPNIFVEVVRFKNVKMKYFDIDMKEKVIEADDVYATILQHELDHLNGVVLVNKMSPIKKMATSFKLNRLNDIGRKMTLESSYISSEQEQNRDKSNP